MDEDEDEEDEDFNLSNSFNVFGGDKIVLLLNDDFLGDDLFDEEVFNDDVFNDEDFNAVNFEEAFIDFSNHVSASVKSLKIPVHICHTLGASDLLNFFS